MTGEQREEWLEHGRRFERCCRDARECCDCGEPIGSEDPLYLVTPRSSKYGYSSLCPCCAGCAAKRLNEKHSRYVPQPRQCPACDRAVILCLERYDLRKYWRTLGFCCARCRNRYYSAKYRSRHPRPKKVRPAMPCGSCGKDFVPRRADAQTCSPACREKLYRSRKVSVTARETGNVALPDSLAATD
jgi:hypothetical protein